MKKAAVLVLFILCLAGCSSSNKEIERGMALRDRLLQAESCSFDAEITADYGDKIHTFSMSCQGDSKGGITFTVTAPETIGGITGTIDDEGGNLTFDAVALHFELLTDDQLSPISAPWIFLKTLRSGYLTSAGMEGELLRLSMGDSYDEDALHVDIWLDKGDVPQQAEMVYDGKRILSLAVKNFRIA